MLNIRKYLAELMGVQQITDDDIRKELDELKLDNLVEKLTKEGHIAADPEVQLLARKAVAGGATPDELLKLLSSPKPIPAQTTTITPPSGPAAGADQVEAAIQARMAETNEPYHVAAGAIATGGGLQATTPQGAS
jgi:hypothetical protein